MSQFTDAQKLACARRELGLRRRVYPGFVRRDKMRQDGADREIALMEDIVRDYERKLGVSSSLFAEEDGA